MGELYRLNKDELIKLLLKVRDTWTDEEMENELIRRKNNRKMNMIKKSLLNLRVVPHLTTFIEKYENHIKTMSNIYENLEFLREIKMLSLFTNWNKGDKSLFDDINNNSKSWAHSDCIVYIPCQTCNNYEILLYENDKLCMSNLYLETRYIELSRQQIDLQCPFCF